ncbi:hypothetical protein, partial [Pseudomonas sp. 2995-3]|uniref:hypothetical protein n=1 Tax=Pseudomonas sp. 2995-3 TaxID=1712680 RepID=UPI001C43D40B
MTVPLIVLAVLAIFSGFVNTPLGFWLEDFLVQDVAVGYQAHGEMWLVGLSIGVAVAGIGLAFLMYYKNV